MGLAVNRANCRKIAPLRPKGLQEDWEGKTRIPEKIGWSGDKYDSKGQILTFSDGAAILLKTSKIEFKSDDVDEMKANYRNTVLPLRPLMTTSVLFPIT